ncbi:MAG: class I SAM-dependent methyltransferase [Alphaproteobacteria bacterium]|nr:class I SAM-dependent methyltransferase [Alphaproteobacteria bacterium]
MSNAIARTGQEAAGPAHSGPCIDQVQDHGIIDCAACGYRHVLPLPEADEEIAGAANASFAPPAGEDLAWMALGDGDRLALLEGTLRRPRREGGFRLLDVGAGGGHFARAARERGFLVTAVEPSREAAGHARGFGLNVLEAPFSAETARGLGRFEAVHMMNVLEHVPNPRELLALAYDLLLPGGAICVGVRNDYNAFQLAAARLQELPHWWVTPPRRLNFLDFSSLARLLVRSGFSLGERFTSFPMELFLLFGERHMARAAWTRAPHRKRKVLDLALEAAHEAPVRRAFYNALAEAGLGHDAILFAVKPHSGGE